ncbi:DUF4225 domain-containing protein [Pantoea osteomyelitidis]|uniref:DUF4225 domain-containing protein n=1 Tax=Pantoea osteomyelitidis TaxID=3230026 RepID=A0ABW7PVA7_9GAMM
MDIYSGSNNRFSSYYAAIGQSAAQELLRTANIIASRHIRDAMLNVRFREEVKRLCESNLNLIRKAKTESECKLALNNLQKERASIKKQGAMLLSASPKTYLSLKFSQDEKGAWGYVIDGITIIIGTLQFAAGFGVAAASLGTGTVVGVAFGAMLVLHGTNGIEEGLTNLITGESDSSGYLKKGYVSVAKFLGFSEGIGEISYSVMDTGLSLYGMGRLVLKPDAWRLFRSLPSDKIRAIRTMSATELLIETYSNGQNIKSVYEKTKISN